VGLATALPFERNFDWLREYLDGGHFDIERALTLLDLQAQSATEPERRDTIRRRRNDVKSFLVQRLDVRGVGADNLDQARQICKSLFALGDRIITFNYDWLLERVLWDLKLWSPNGGYGTSPGMTELGDFRAQVPRIPGRAAAM
jgi:hypothetical protein